MKYYTYNNTPSGIQFKTPVFEVGDTCYIITYGWVRNKNKIPAKRAASKIHKARVVAQEWWKANTFHPVYYNVRYCGVKFNNVHFGEIFVTRAKAQEFNDSNDKDNFEFYKKIRIKHGTVCLHNLLRR